jgi:exosortase D (VPLPA-CTERM-specific)
MLTHRSLGAGNGTSPLIVSAWIGLALITGGLVWFAFATSFGLVFDKFDQPEYSHGYLIPLISAWIVYQRWPILRRSPRGTAPIGWLLVAAAAASLLFFDVANISRAPYLSFLLLVAGFGYLVLGRAIMRQLWVPLVFLAFAFPLPDDLYVSVSLALQLISSQLGSGLLEMMGIPNFLDGNIIDLGSYQLQVAEACSGLRYLLPLLAFAAICAWLYRGRWWERGVILLSTIPITVFFNSFRIALTGVLVHLDRPELADGFLHLFEGWLVFLAALVVLFVEMWLLTRLRGDRSGMAGVLDFDRIAGRETEMPAGGATAPGRSPIAAATVGVTIFGVAALTLVAIDRREETIPERPGLFTFPMQLDVWRGTPGVLDARVAELLAADDYLHATYTAPSDATAPVNLWIAYLDSQQGDPHFHSPATCLPGAGWEFAAFDQVPMPATAFGEAPYVNRALATNGEQRVLMYFWYELRGRTVATSLAVRYFNFVDSIRLNRSDGALVRVMTALTPDESLEAADRRLTAFLGRAQPHLEAHLGR